MAEKAINTGGPAFPCHPEIIPHRDHDFAGMTLRDYFAAKAMATLIQVSFNQDDEHNADLTADRAYWFADAMLKARGVK